MRRILPLVLSGILLAVGCRPATPEPQPTVTIVHDGTLEVVTITVETSASDVLRTAGIILDDTDGADRVNPPGHNRITDGMTITVVRVVEEITVIEEPIPFERQVLPNAGLPTGETRLIQSGENGVAEITFRITYEDGVEISRSQIKNVPITPPTNEVVMVGSQGELPTVTVNGTLAYISAGNAWIVRQNSANRRPLTVDGGVDGRVFELSGDGQRLLFTQTAGTSDSASGTPAARRPTATPEGEPFNSLWVILDTSDPDSEPLQLELDNILDANWVPGAELEIVYSTAEPRPSFPGWQANNDLWYAQISANGEIIRTGRLLEPSGGGIYGWYGTFFDFSPDGSLLAWAQPDAIGVLLPDYGPPEEDGETTPTPEGTEEATEEPPNSLPPAFTRQTLVSFAPRNAYDFVWIPSLTWSPDGLFLVATTHGAPVGSESPEDSPVFNLTALPKEGGFSIDVAERAGMWAAPQFSPIRSDSSLEDVVIAYLESVDQLDSVVSHYRLVIVDRDGSNRRTVFPPEGQPGLQPQIFVWSADARQIALTYQGNLYLVDVVTGLAQQVTGDGLSSTPRWTP